MLSDIDTIAATADDLQTLDIYSPLATMPKNVDPEYDSMKRDNLSDVLAETGSGSEKQLTQRELARRKKKRALALKVHGESAAAQNGSQAAAEPEGEERSGKKARSEGGDAENEKGSANVTNENNMDVL